MPSPIAHSVTGYALSRLPLIAKQSRLGTEKPPSPRQKKIRQTLSRLNAIAPLLAVYAIFVSNLPDLDFLPQLVTNLNIHRGPSHSFIAALHVSALLALVINRLQHQISYKIIFSLTFLFYCSHLFLDAFTSGGSGLPLLWPLTNSEFRAPFPLFPPVHHSRGLLDRSHFVFVFAELIYAIALISGIQRLKPKASTHRQTSSGHTSSSHTPSH